MLRSRQLEPEKPEPPADEPGEQTEPPEPPPTFPIFADPGAPREMLKGIADEEPFYFVHTFAPRPAAEHLLAGITTTTDMYFFGDEVGKALAGAGMRAVVTEPLIDFATPRCAGPHR